MPQRLINYFNPHLYMSSNKTYISWMDTNGTLFFTKSVTSGATFDPAINVTKIRCKVAVPILSISGNNTYYLISDIINDKGVISFIKNTDNGNTFGHPVQNNEGIPLLCLRKWLFLTIIFMSNW